MGKRNKQMSKEKSVSREVGERERERERGRGGEGRGGEGRGGEGRGERPSIDFPYES